MRAEEAVDGVKVLGVLLQTVQDIPVPAFRTDNEPAFSSRSQQFLVHESGIAAHDLVSADKNQRRRDILQIPEQRRDVRIRAVGAVIQCLYAHGRVGFFVAFIGFSRGSQIRPGRNGDDRAGQRQLHIPQLQAQRVAKPAAGTFSAQGDSLRRVAFVQQIPICGQRVLQRGRVGVFRSQPVAGAEHANAAPGRQCGGKALRVFQIAADVPTAVQIQNYALPALILGKHPAGRERFKVMRLHDDVSAVSDLHQFADFILPSAQRLPGAAVQQRF